MNITWKKPEYKPHPQYEGDPTIKEERQKDKDMDGVTEVTLFKKETDWKFLSKFWNKVKRG